MENKFEEIFKEIHSKIPLVSLFSFQEANELTTFAVKAIGLLIRNTSIESASDLHTFFSIPKCFSGSVLNMSAFDLCVLCEEHSTALYYAKIN
jgi:hypothetical protein